MSAMDVDAKEEKYDYDLIVIGGGSGGLASAKEAATLGANVALFDFVKPTIHGTKWGLGGTCVNVGCIPKKLMHYSGLLHSSFHDAHQLGWNFEKPQFNWEKMIETVNGYVKSLNWGYRLELGQKGVKYFNNLARFVDAHTIEYSKNNAWIKITAKYIIIAVGGRPDVPNIPGHELAITSDDIFWRETPPNKTLLVGASYISLETAGFLHEMGYDVTVMVRSLLLRGFDRECSDAIGDYMNKIGIKFKYGCIPTKLEKTDDKIKAFYSNPNTKEEFEDTFDTVLFATGRKPDTKGLNTDKVSIELAESGKFLVNNEQTNIPNIFAIGDIVEGGLELTPVAIQAGQLLAKRLFGGSTKLMNYVFVPTTVFTPIEYGCCGYSEEQAKEVYGEEDLEIYIQKGNSLEMGATHRVDLNHEDIVNPCFWKLICAKSQKERIVGFHYVGPNAGEVTQGFALAIKLKATKEDFDSVIGIHPTSAETFTSLKVTKRSGKNAEATGC